MYRHGVVCAHSQVEILSLFRRRHKLCLLAGVTRNQRREYWHLEFLIYIADRWKKQNQFYPMLCRLSAGIHWECCSIQRGNYTRSEFWFISLFRQRLEFFHPQLTLEKSRVGCAALGLCGLSLSPEPNFCRKKGVLFLVYRSLTMTCQHQRAESKTQRRRKPPQNLWGRVSVLFRKCWKTILQTLTDTHLHQWGNKFVVQWSVTFRKGCEEEKEKNSSTADWLATTFKRQVRSLHCAWNVSIWCDL